VGHAQLFTGMHGAAGTLFAVSKGGIEEEDAVVLCGVLVHRQFTLDC
jgi:hypothetical protein